MMGELKLHDVLIKKQLSVTTILLIIIKIEESDKRMYTKLFIWVCLEELVKELIVNFKTVGNRRICR